MFDTWLENLRMSSEKVCSSITTCYKCGDDLYVGDNVFFDPCSNIYLCEHCVIKTEDEDAEEFKLILENFEEIKLEDYNIDFFEEDWRDY